jgi:tRNA G46 methylase TrmB
MTLEIRQDRVYQTFLRAFYAGVNNVCILGGNAREILPSYLQPDQIDHLFVNHPEPPQQTGAKEDSEAQHLLNEVILFFCLICFV